MIQAIRYKVEGLLKRDDELSRKVLTNILISFGVKSGSILIGLVLVPLTIAFISPVQYGIWLTISSIVGWFSFFDIGMGNGLRNSVTTELALGRHEEARKYVSTTYVLLTIIGTLLFLVFLAVHKYINWRSLLNIPQAVSDNIPLIILIALGSFCVQFVMQLINTVLTAIHKPALSGFITFLGQLTVLIIFLVFRYLFEPSLVVLVSVLTIAPLFVLAVTSVLLFKTTLKQLSPSIKYIDFSYATRVLRTGSAFFLIQIGALLILQTNNIIIARVIGPEAVTTFNIAYKLFSTLIMVFTIVITPYWSAFTTAYAKADFKWMKDNLIKIRKVWFTLSVIMVSVLYFFSEEIYHVWIGETVTIPSSLSLSMALYVIGFTGLMLNCYFLNGISKLRIQLWLYVFVCIINFPLSVFLGEKFGVTGVTYSNVIIFFFMGIILWIQSSKIINQTAKGLWLK